jgi:hypothetical protein
MILLYKILSVWHWYYVYKNIFKYLKKYIKFKKASIFFLLNYQNYLYIIINYIKGLNIKSFICSFMFIKIIFYNYEFIHILFFKKHR